MLSVTDLKPGTTFTKDNQIYKVLSYTHVKLGRGAANIKVKVRNLKSQKIIQMGFLSGQRVQEAPIDKKEVVFLYNDDQNYYFMEGSSFEQFFISGKSLEDEAKFLKENLKVNLLLFEDKPLSVELPIKVEYKVTETGPSTKGNSATNVFKEAVINNNLVVKVPLFINSGDIIIVDTRTGDYIERKKIK